MQNIQGFFYGIVENQYYLSTFGLCHLSGQWMTNLPMREHNHKAHLDGHCWNCCGDLVQFSAFPHCTCNPEVSNQMGEHEHEHTQKHPQQPHILCRHHADSVEFSSSEFQGVSTCIFIVFSLHTPVSFCVECLIEEMKISLCRAFPVCCFTLQADSNRIAPTHSTQKYYNQTTMPEGSGGPSPPNPEQAHSQQQTNINNNSTRCNHRANCNQ